MNSHFGIFESFILGAVQGLTEYLPISSSAHLILVPRFLKMTEPGLAYDVFLHLGTLGATLSFFYKDWVALLSAAYARFFKGKPVEEISINTVRMEWVIVATIPALIAGALFHKWVEEVLRGNSIIMATLIIGGAGLWGVDYFSKSQNTLQSFNLKKAFIVGCIQCLALIPGMSRSGSTMMAGRFVGLSRSEAARFSFLISAPVTAAALVFELRKWNDLLQSFHSEGNPASAWIILAVGALSSFAFGMLAIGGMLKLLRRFGFLSFFIYRVFLAGAIYVFLV